MNKEKNYIIYKITNKLNNKIYIGCHITKNINDNYMGSGKLIIEDIKKMGERNFKKEILFNLSNIDEMRRKERDLVNSEFIKRDDTYNIIIGGGFSSYGTTNVKDKNGNVMKVNVEDPRYLSGELVSVAKGKVGVKDNNGNCFQVDMNDERYLSGELVGLNKGKIGVKDKEGNCFQVNIDDERYLSGELVGHSKGLKMDFIFLKDENNNTIKVDRNDERYLSGELVHVNKNKATVKDKDGNCFQIDINDERYLSGELISIRSGKKHSEETKRKLSLLNKGQNVGTKWMYNKYLNKLKRVNTDELDIYLSEGWKIGMNKSRK